MPAVKPEPRYDVFISYRRGTADELALLLQTHLQNHGLTAFLDHDLRRGVFDELILRRIAESPNFLLILSPQALDRCSDPDDWLRKEIVQAISSRRNIIPLQVGLFQFTSELVKALDPAIRDLARYQMVEYSRTYLKSTVERIVEIVQDDKAERERAEAADAEAFTAEPAHRKERKRHEVEIGRRTKKQTGGEAQRIVASPTPAPLISPGTVAINPQDGQTYVWIPPGNFQMGCSAGDGECYDREKPAHPVTITKGFWLGQTPVTQSAYQRVINANPSRFRGEQLSVESVTWDEAKTYCEAVGGRLPTEAEWEYAARAGTTTARYGDLDAIAWYDKNSRKTTHPVAQKQPNAWGLYDMIGNVWEWVGDWYDDKYYGRSPSVDPTGPASGQYRIVRGGSWVGGSWLLRSSYRGRYQPGGRVDDLGFRCVREVLP